MDENLQKPLQVLTDVVEDLKHHRPRAVLLFGSMARLLAGMDAGHHPNDIDLLVVGDQIPLSLAMKDYGFPTEMLRMRIHTLTEIARSLRYDARAVALAKLYGNQLVQQHAKRVIAACLLLGSEYRSFGIEQIELDGREDPRDYAVHRVLLGRRWWRQVTDYARERRGPLKRFSDKVARADRFVPQ
jgi:predicted nucleotidyltransferase